jgi:hypothetical protein
MYLIRIVFQVLSGAHGLAQIFLSFVSPTDWILMYRRGGFSLKVKIVDWTIKFI